MDFEQENTEFYLYYASSDVYNDSARHAIALALKNNNAETILEFLTDRFWMQSGLKESLSNISFVAHDQTSAHDSLHLEVTSSLFNNCPTCYSLRLQMSSKE